MRCTLHCTRSHSNHSNRFLCCMPPRSGALLIIKWQDVLHQYPRHPRVYLLEVLSFTKPCDATCDRTSPSYYLSLLFLLNTISPQLPKYSPARKYPIFTNIIIIILYLFSAWLFTRSRDVSTPYYHIRSRHLSWKNRKSKAIRTY